MLRDSALIDRLCKEVHDAWWKEKASQGYRHPCMVPYNQLTDQQKQLDRTTVIRILNVLEKEGYLNGND